MLEKESYKACPICGEDNNCQHGQGSCWCETVVFPKHLLDMIPDEKKGKAWKDYLKICKVGRSQSFLEIIKTGNLSSPFEENTIKTIASKIKEYLDKIDDMKL